MSSGYSALIYAAVVCFAVAALEDDVIGEHTKCVKTRCIINDKSLRFFALADHGGLPIWPYVTPAQTKVAKTIAKIGTEIDSHFHLAVGDNFYMVGVQHVNDSRFQKTFENVYNLSESQQRPWYVVAGNHDHYGDVDAQIAYTKLSKRWVFPDYYYSVHYQLSDGTTIDFFMIDTIVLCGNTREGKFSNFADYLTAPSNDRQTMGPQNPELAEKQWHWLDSQLKNSTSNYAFVVGHYPVYSSAEHGPTACLLERLRPMLHRYRINAYFSGHDHSMQHLNETQNGWMVHYVLSGAGAYEIFSNKHLMDVPADSSRFVYPEKQSWMDLAGKVGLGNGAFVLAEVTASNATFRYITGRNVELHSFSLHPRK